MKEFKLESGKFYRTRDGRKVGPIAWSSKGNLLATAPGFSDSYWYTQHNPFYNGSYANITIVSETEDDLVEEWVDD